MAEIRKFVFFRHLRAEADAYVLRYRKGDLVQQGRGLSFFFQPMSNAIAEVPMGDREVSFMAHGRSADFQDVSVQGVLSYRVRKPDRLAERVAFGIDLATGAYLQKPLQTLSDSLTQRAQQLAIDYLTKTPLAKILGAGFEVLHQRLQSGLQEDTSIQDLGLEIAALRIIAVKPAPDLERALEAPAREAIQQSADEAAFARRALAVEKERAIQENELNNRVELAKREEELITQEGQNARQRAVEAAEAKKIQSEADAETRRIRGEANAAVRRLEAAAEADALERQMEIYGGLSTQVLLALAANELARKLDKIEHLQISPELLGPAITQLLRLSKPALPATTQVGTPNYGPEDR